MADPMVCPCGCGLTSDAWSENTRAMIAEQIHVLGPTTRISTPGGTWKVPRVYIAFHGIAASDVAILAEKYGWKQVEPA